MAIHTRSFIWVSGVKALPMDNMPAECIGCGRHIKVDAFNRIEGVRMFLQSETSA